MSSNSNDAVTFPVFLSQANDEARRNQLMRDMAQLRLRAEVTQLEGSLQQQAGRRSPSAASTASSSLSGCDDGETGSVPRGSVDLPPYLVPDAPTLCEHLMQVKQMAASSRFIVIIPLAGINQRLYLSVAVYIVRFECLRFTMSSLYLLII